MAEVKDIDSGLTIAGILNAAKIAKRNAEELARTRQANASLGLENDALRAQLASLGVTSGAQPIDSTVRGGGSSTGDK